MGSILKQNKLLLLITIVLSIISSIAYVYISIILKNVTDIALSGDLSAFKIVVIKSVLYLIILGLISYIYSICSKRLVCNIVQALRKKVFDGILRRNKEDFARVNTADYISAFTNDIKLIEEGWILPLLTLLQNAVIFIGALVVLFIISPIIALFLIGCFVLMLIVPAIFGKGLQDRQDRLSKQLSILTTKIKDVLSGYEVIKSYNIGRHIQTQFNDKNNEAVTARFRADKLMAASESLSEILAYLTLFSGFFIGAYLIIVGKISAGTLLALIQLSSSFVNPLMIIMQSLPHIQGVKPVLKRLDDFSNYEVTSFIGTHEPSFEKYIKAENISFSYNGDQKVLVDINLTIKRNKKYAIVGHSGCGKSTLIKLLTGCYSGFQGSITYDGTNICELDTEKLNKMIAVIHQNVYMFDDSIKENIYLYESFSQNELEHVLEVSGVNKFINLTPNGLESSVGENGSNISGGQRQRIAIARALIQNKPFLILDEGTAAIDMQNAYDIENRLLKLKDLTLLTITHNMNNDILRMYDEIIYMENGKIVETGRLDELLSHDSSFQRFFYLVKEETVAL
ncbi:ATP-binding cassette domain-containing protein [Alkalibaculum sp. M08DMB]|uniref:ATP-binding cassette domain-containing protein n=1 Tax=Alkalibaculum sporogenes TaxID=2655001 RepID=A0A6A7K745_9FIRM|nr:ABC transporter ATP-binding protein [Alkalibaculum sporogenes]MPW25244.1 ATP-binding cassette domain-containing protein [Alkalibaculum sporogenes]